MVMRLGLIAAAGENCVNNSVAAFVGWSPPSPVSASESLFAAVFY